MRRLGPDAGPDRCARCASKVSGLPPEKVNIHTTLLGCGFGRRAAPDFVVEAVIASKASGRPVKVVWTREEDIKYDLYRAATCQRIEAGFDGQGQLTAWSHKVVTSITSESYRPQGDHERGRFHGLWGLADFPGSPDNNRIMYEIPNLYIEYVMSDLPIPVVRGAPSRMARTPSLLSVSWTNWPMRRARIPWSSVCSS